MTELHALKRLYGLLQKNSTRLARPNQSSAHFLDEKSSHLLKKLLDVATQQVLYSQEKRISYTPEMSKSEGEFNLNPCENEKFQECHSVALPIKPSEPANLALVAELKMFQNPCPISESACVKKLESKHAAIDKSNRCILSHTSELGNMRKPSQPLKSTSHRVKRRLSSKNVGELSLIPAQKHRQVEPFELLSQVSSRSRKSDRICPELTNHKRKSATCISSDQVESNQNKSLQPTQRSKSSLSNRTAQIIQRNDQLTESRARAIANKHKKFARLNRSKAWRYLSSKESSHLNSSSNSSTRSIPLPPSEPRTIHFRRRKASPHKAKVEIIQKKDQLSESKSRFTKHAKPCRSNHSSRFSARSNQLTPTRQNRQKTRKTLSKPPARNHLSLVPHQPRPSLRPTKAGQESKDEEEPGKFRRLKDKLSIIFHHHHHHHLHAREDEAKGPEEAKSLWKHLMAAFHLSRGSGKEAAAKGRHHGYLRVMIEGLLHHLWGIQWRRWRQREKVASRRKSKKLRWWAWFRRKGGVVVGGRRRLRLRMGNGGSHRRIA